MQALKSLKNSQQPSSNLKNLHKKSSTSTHTSQNQLKRRQNTPKPIPQTMINHAKSNIIKIPINKYPLNILKLYLPYNSIESVQGLSIYKNLTNLNLSYNKLSNIQQLLTEINQLRQLKYLNIRNNRFIYGYEDIVIEMMNSNIEKLDDIQLSAQKKKRQIFIYAHKISQILIPALYKVNTKIKQIQSKQNKQNEQNNKQMKIIAKISELYSHRKRTYLPTDRHTLLQKILEIVYLFCCLEISNKQNYSLMNSYMQIYKDIVSEILLRFQHRNNKSLVNSLIMNDNDKQRQYSIEQLVCKFGHQLNGYSFNLKNSLNPGKYLQKIDPKQVTQHALYKLLQQQQRLQHQQIRTLDPNMRIKVHQQQKQQYKIYYERFPIIIYERNYLQIIEQIMNKMIEQLLRVYGRRYRYRYGCNKNGPIQNNKIININYIQRQQQQVNTNTYNNDNKIQNINKNEGIKYQTTKKHQQTKYQTPQLSNSRSRKTIQKHNPKNQQNNQNINIENTLKQTKIQVNQKTQKNLSKYTLYQINLAYKVLITLKKKCRKFNSKNYQAKYSCYLIEG